MSATTRPADADDPGSTRQAFRTFVEPKSGTSLSYPADWLPKPSTDYALVLAPAGSDPSEATMSLDVPDLPAHIPGWIPIGLVRNGYVDDVKKAHPDAAVADLPPPTIAGANVRLTQADWSDGTGAVREWALIVVHGDHVVLLRATARPPRAAVAREAFDAVVRSLRWRD